MNNRGIALKNIHSYLAEYTAHIRQLNTSGFFDINKEAENSSINLLNATYGYRLKNANNELSDNFPAIDLIDEEKQIVIQVTSDPDSEKILYTVEKYISKNLYVKYKHLYIYILTDKNTYYKPTTEKIKSLIGDKATFDIKKNVFDNKDVGKAISNFTDLEKIINIEKILNLEFGSSKLKLLKSKSNKQDKFKFDYRNRLTNFLGREDEISYLNEFISTESKFSWWMITGKAGSGKSRLALEFGHTLGSSGWEWGFLQPNQISTFDWSINYPRPILLVIDYVRSNHKDVLALIRNLENKSNYESKFRLLLIERVITGDWWKDLINDFYASNSLFKDKPLELSGLQTDVLFKIVEKILSDEESTIAINKETIIDNLQNLDPEQRPLFAMFAGIALAKNQIISSWNQHNLLEFILDEDLKLTKEVFKEYDSVIINKHIDLLAVANVCYGLTGFDINNIFDEKIEWLPTPFEFDTELYEFISYGSVLDDRNRLTVEFSTNHPEDSKIQLSPMMPDVLGEYFVLKTLESNNKFKFRFTNKLKDFFKLTLNVNFYYYNVFIRKLLQDFPTHSLVISFLIGSDSSVIDNRGSAGHMVVEAMENLHYNNSDYLKIMLNYTKILATNPSKNNGQKSFSDDPDRVYQNACNLMVFKYSGNLVEQETYYNLVRNNTEKIEVNPKIFYDNNGDFQEFFNAEQVRTEEENKEYVDSYFSKRKVSDERIAHIEVISIAYILETIKSINKIDLATAYIDRIFYLCNKFTYSLIKVESLRTLIDFGPKHIPNFKEKVDDLFEKILLTPTQVKAVNTIHQQYTFAKMIIEYEVSIQDSYEALNYLKRFKSYLVSLNPNSNVGDNLIQLASTAEGIAKQYYKRSILVTGDLFFNEILHINSILKIPPQPSSPMYQIIYNVNKYRSGNFN